MQPEPQLEPQQKLIVDQQIVGIDKPLESQSDTAAYVYPYLNLDEMVQLHFGTLLVPHGGDSCILSKDSGKHLVKTVTSSIILFTPLICPITYSAQLPVPEIGCKFLPCAKTLLDYTEKPISFPELESQYSQQFKGLHMLLDIDLLNLNAYEQSAGGPTEMDPRDAALLADIEPLTVTNKMPKAFNSIPKGARECPAPGSQRMQPESLPPDLGLLMHKLKAASDSHALPVLVSPIAPSNETLQMKFGVAPSNKRLMKANANEDFESLPQHFKEKVKQGLPPSLMPEEHNAEREDQKSKKHIKESGSN
ncbi:GH25215 [Drosophila grimshawi]|uniref:GH25215 n=1 Tax=Drosophila grimshawi TaxID=7222 RepID=B4JZA8_DROGR|nr:GH25215 [Drosophila grimshawi]